MIGPMRIPLVMALAFIGACTTMPSGPSVLVLPGTGKSFEQFRADDQDCRQYAGMQIGGTTPNQSAADSVAKSAVIGTAVGALAGAAMGGQRGAAAGAGTGLAVGAVAGTAAGDASAYGAQRRYDYAFQQCMYAKGHKIPVAGRFESAPASAPAPYAPPPPPPAPPSSR